MASSDEKEEKKKHRLPLSVRAAIASLLVVAVVFLPSTVLIGICMIPSFVAALVDRQKQKTLWLTVGAMNMAGTLPAVMGLWEAGQQMDRAMDLATRPVTLVVAYGGAAIGWIIQYNVTPLVAGGLLRRSQKRLKDIEKRQMELVRRWGDDVRRVS